MFPSGDQTIVNEKEEKEKVNRDKRNNMLEDGKQMYE